MGWHRARAATIVVRWSGWWYPALNGGRGSTWGTTSSKEGESGDNPRLEVKSPAVSDAHGHRGWWGDVARRWWPCARRQADPAAGHDLKAPAQSLPVHV